MVKLNGPSSRPEIQNLAIDDGKQRDFSSPGLMLQTWSNRSERMERDVSITVQDCLEHLNEKPTKPFIRRIEMDSSFLFADLITNQTSPPKMMFKHVSCYRDALSGESDTLKGFQYLPNASSGHCGTNDSYLKAFKKGSKVIAKVVRLLEKPEKALDGSEADTNAKSKTDNASSFSAESGLLVGGPPCEGHARNVEGISTFHRVTFTFPDRSMETKSTAFQSSQFMHFSCPSLNVDGRVFTLPGQTKFSHIDLVSGVCLFNSGIMQRSQRVTHGLQIDQLRMNEATLYELEYIARSSAAIADFVCHIISNGTVVGDHVSAEKSVQVRVNLDVPSFHYYGGIEQAVNESKITSTEALTWLDHIASRSEKITKVFKQATSDEIKKRLQVDHLPNNLEFYTSTARTSIVWLCLQNALRNDAKPNLHDTLERLNNESDDTWNLFMSMLPEKQHPQNFRDLGYTCYVYQCVRPALLRTDTQDLMNDTKPVRQERLLISIDDSVERRIYSTAQKLLKKIRQSSLPNLASTDMIEAYLSRRVFINSNEAGSNLYLDDPSPVRIRQSDTGRENTFSVEINGSHRTENNLNSDGMSGEGSELDPFDVITTLYGKEHADSLHSLFTSVGLDRRMLDEGKNKNRNLEYHSISAWIEHKTGRRGDKFCSLGKVSEVLKCDT